MCHWVTGVYPAQTELKIANVQRSRWWSEGEAKRSKEKPEHF